MSWPSCVSYPVEATCFISFEKGSSPVQRRFKWANPRITSFILPMCIIFKCNGPVRLSAGRAPGRAPLGRRCRPSGRPVRCRCGRGRRAAATPALPHRRRRRSASGRPRRRTPERRKAVAASSRHVTTDLDWKVRVIHRSPECGRKRRRRPSSTPAGRAPPPRPAATGPAQPSWLFQRTNPVFLRLWLSFVDFFLCVRFFGHYFFGKVSNKVHRRSLTFQFLTAIHKT